MDAVQAGCLLEEVDGFITEASRAAPGGQKAQLLLEKARRWRARLLQRHLEIPNPGVPELV